MWNLIVNLTKNKIMVVRNGGKIYNHKQWSYNNTIILMKSNLKK